MSSARRRSLPVARGGFRLRRPLDPFQVSVVEHHGPQRAERRRARAALGDGAENLQISRVIGRVRVTGLRVPRRSREDELSMSAGHRGVVVRGVESERHIRV